MNIRQRVHSLLHPNAQTRVVTPAGNISGKFPEHVSAVSSLRRRTTISAQGSVLVPHEQAPKRGMWVHYQGRTGILTNLEAGDIATVMLVDDEKGENVLEVHAPCSQLRQAFFEEIPQGRRPKYADAVRFGYVSKT